MNISIINKMMPSAFVCDVAGKYFVTSALTEEDIINAATTILGQRFSHKNDFINNDECVRVFFSTRLAVLQHEVFCVMFLDNKHAMIDCEQMFRGTISQAAVYPREVVKRALELNAACVIFAHNHPSGCTQPSLEDKNITKVLVSALALIDVKVLDHIIVGGADTTSFACLGLL